MEAWQMAAKLSDGAILAILEAHPGLRERFASIAIALADQEGNLKEADATRIPELTAGRGMANPSGGLKGRPGTLRRHELHFFRWGRTPRESGAVGLQPLRVWFPPNRHEAATPLSACRRAGRG